MGWANTSGGSATTTFWDYISNGLQDGGQLAYTVGRESRGGGRKGGDRQKNRFMPTGVSREPCGKVCYAKSQRLIRKSGHSFHGAPSLSASARSISPSASSARSSKLILGGRSSGEDSIGWAGAGEGAVEANRKAWRARGDELGPGAGLRMYASRGDGRRGYGGQRRTRGGRRAYLGDGGHETGCSLHFCMRGCFAEEKRPSTAAFRSSTLDFLSTADGTKSTRHPSPPRRTRPLTTLDYIIGFPRTRR